MLPPQFMKKAKPFGSKPGKSTAVARRVKTKRTMAKMTSRYAAKSRDM